MKWNFCKWDPRHIWRWFEMLFKSDYYSQDSRDAQIRFQTVFASLARQHTTTMSNPEWRECFRAAEQNPWFQFLMVPCWKAMSPEYVVTDSFVVTTATHADRLVISGHTNPFWSLAIISAKTVCRKDLIQETNLICLQSEQSLSAQVHSD